MRFYFFIFFIFIPHFLFGIENPYKAISFDEKFNVVFNYFLNEKLKEELPKKPILQKVKPLGDIEKYDYERYYNYVQRVKFLKDENQKKQQKALEEYAGKVGYYNGKLANLKKDFLENGRINEVIQSSINRTFKIFYGNPKIKDLTLYKNKIKATIYNKSFYGFEYKLNKDIVIDIPQNIQENFFNRYKGAKTLVNFVKIDDTLIMKDANVVFENKNYKATFLDKVLLKIKLDIKINNDIFQPINIKKN